MTEVRLNRAASVALACVLGGCSATASAPNATESRVTSVTFVELFPDGTHTIRKLTNTGGPSFESLSGASCDDVDRFYDGAEGSGNELCVTGSGTASFAALATEAGISFGSVESFTPIESAGYFSASAPGANDKCQTFPQSSSLLAPGGQSANIVDLTLGSTCVQLTCPGGDFLCTIDCEDYLKQECFPDSDAPASPPSDREIYCAHNVTCP